MADRVGKQLGNYHLTQFLGHGNFADVYLAEHIFLRTVAAIKVIDARLRSSDVEIFLNEARTIAHLVHPNIVRVLEFGVENSTPYLVMDYAINGTLRQYYPQGTRLHQETILPHVKQVAAALQYAHLQKLIHRDVKPDNMLIGRNKEILLSDFGLALLASTSHSESQLSSAGTIAYMAPEQVEGKPRFASDQYALGVVVYEWLCGERPFNGTYWEVVSQHMSSAPPPLRSKVPTIPANVEEVVLIALQKDPSKRFASIQAFANAFEQACHAKFPGSIAIPPLNPQWQPPVVASPSNQEQQLVTVAAPPGQFTQPPPATTHSAHNLFKRAISRRAVLLSLAGAAVAGGTIITLASSGKLPFLASSSIATPTPTHSGPPPGTNLYTYHGHYASGLVFGIGWSSDGKRIASGSSDRTAQVWDATDGSHTLTYTGHKNTVTAVAWSPDGKRIASAGDDATVQVWDAMTGETIWVFQGHTSDVHSVVWSPDGRHLASGSNDHTVRVWDAVNGHTQSVFIFSDHSSFVWDVVWSPDGTRIASGSSDKTVQVWDAFTGTVHQIYRGHTDELRGVAWAPNGTHIVSSGLDKTARVWDAVSGSTIVLYNDHTDVVDHAAWSPDGIYIASGSGDTTVRVWEAMSGKTVLIYRGHIERVRMVQWSPSVSSRAIASGGYDRTVQVWEAV